MKLSIRIRKEIIRLGLNRQLSNRDIGRRLKISHQTVGRILKQSAHAGLANEAALILDTNSFENHLKTAGNKTHRKSVFPDWNDIQQQLQRRDVTLQLLWEEYRVVHCNNLENTVSYSHFARCYKCWRKKQPLNMRQMHKPGDKMFVDFCGRVVPIFSTEGESTEKAQIFVAVLGASNYTFAYAVKSQKISDWIKCNVQALEFFGGIPQQIVPDNLKSAVIKNTPNELIINKAYSDMAYHYNLIINPARPRKPKDKSLAEIGVQIVQRWILASIRDQKFFSIDELNEEIRNRLELLNNKRMKTYNQSRYERFVTIEKDTLIALPAIRYECSDWIYNTRVPADYHIIYKQCAYSVPYQYVHEQVDARITESIIEILLHGKRIACHQLLVDGNKSTQLEHMPIAHSFCVQDSEEALLEWAKEVGPYTFEWVSTALQDKSYYASRIKDVRKLKKMIRTEDVRHRLESSCCFAIKIGAYTFQRLQNIIRNRSDLRFPEEMTLPLTDHENVRGSNYYIQEETDHAK